jgi:hypothetical protein
VRRLGALLRTNATYTAYDLRDATDGWHVVIGRRSGKRLTGNRIRALRYLTSFYRAPADGCILSRTAMDDGRA